MLLLETILIIILSIFIFLMFSSMISGAVFVPTRMKTVKQMIDLAHLKKGMRAVDLGSGDGRIVISLARRGVYSDGYEINPFLVLWANYKIHKANLSHLAHIYWKSFWNINTKEYDAIFIYGIFYIMKPLEKKLQKELKPGAIVISSTFKFPDWKYTKSENVLYFYKK